MTTFTRYLHLGVPDFATKPWHAQLLALFSQLDSTIYNALIVTNTSLWANNTNYDIGMMAIDEENGLIYISIIGHLSPTTGTFAEARAANGDYWTEVTSRPRSQGVWVTGTVYQAGNFVINGNAFYVSNSTHTSTVFATDLANGLWSLLADVGGYITQQNVLEGQTFS